MKGIEPRLPSSEIKRVTRTYHGKTFKLKWRGLDIIVKRLLSPEEMVDISNDIIDYCSVGDEAVLIPALLDLSFRINVINFYTNIDLPSNIDEINFILYETDLFTCVTEQINRDQLSHIMDVIGLSLHNN